MTEDPRLQRTQFAARAATLASQFQNAVEEYRVGVHKGQMTAPEESTGGGVLALQHIRLVPMNGRGRSYVVGNANRADRVAELRSLAYVDRLSQDRFGERTGLDPAEYAHFLAGAGQFLEMFGLAVTLVNVPAEGPEPEGWVGPTFGGFVAWSVLVLAIGMMLGVLAARIAWAQ